MNHTRNSNRVNIVVMAVVIALATISCARIKQLVRPNVQSDQVNEFNYSIPFGHKNAEPDDGPAGMARLVIFLPGQTRIHLGNLESPPIELQALGESIKSFAAGKSEYEKAVYIAAKYDIDATVLNDVLNKLREHKIDRVNLLISSAERRKDQNGDEGQYEKSMGDIPAPDRLFQVDIRSNAYGEMPGYESKPNPLTLRVRLHRDRSVNLNNESYRDENELSSKLAEVFDAREANGVFRQNSNEIEKTVLFQIDNDGTNSAVTHKYGDLIRVIDALKEGGTSPIVLIDGSSYWQSPHEPDRPMIIASETAPPSRTKVPSTVSGGVLNGKAVILPKPPYPPAAKAVRASGSVTVQITVDEEGNVTQAKAISGHPLLRAAAEQAARGARFTPTLLGGQRVEVTGLLTYNFAPQD